MQHYILKINILSLLILVAWAGCNDDPETPDRNWQLTWSDEFEGEAGQLPDPEKWGFDVGTDWGNQQLEYDTDRADNASLDGAGHLVITTKRENYAGSNYTSARITTQGLFEQTYGRFEARIKIPTGAGIWPAFWLLGADIQTTGWPECGEIDIMEARGQQPSIVHGSVHGPGYSAGEAITDSYSLTNDRFDNDFHVYAVEWGEDYIDYFVDDELYLQVRPDDLPGEWVYDHDFFIILNVAVGGSYVGFPNNDTPFPQTMEVDWVKVYSEI